MKWKKLILSNLPFAVFLDILIKTIKLYFVEKNVLLKIPT